MRCDIKNGNTFVTLYITTFVITFSFKNVTKKDIMIITIGGTKGGTGKSTTAVNLAVLLARSYNVLLIDAAHPQSVSQFFSIRSKTKNDFTCIALSGQNILPHIQREGDNYDFVIIDVGGFDSPAQRYALALSHVYICPVGPSLPEIGEMPNVDSLITEARALNSDLQAFVFVNRADAVGESNEEAVEALKAITKQFTVIEAPVVVTRKAYRYAFGEGKGIIEMTADPSTRKGQEEFIGVMAKCLKTVDFGLETVS